MDVILILQWLLHKILRRELQTVQKELDISAHPNEIGTDINPVITSAHLCSRTCSMEATTRHLPTLFEKSYTCKRSLIRYAWLRQLYSSLGVVLLRNKIYRCDVQPLLAQNASDELANISRFSRNFYVRSSVNTNALLNAPASCSVFKYALWCDANEYLWIYT